MNQTQRSVITGFLLLLGLIGSSIGASAQSERERTVGASQKWERVYVGDDGARFKSVYSLPLPGGKKSLRWLWLGDDKGSVRFTVIDPDSSASLEPTKSNPAFFALSKLEVRQLGGIDPDKILPVNSVLFLDQNIGYLLKGNKVFRTDNGGFHWSLMYHTPNRPDNSMATLQSIVLTPSKRACIVGMYSLENLVTNSLVLCTDRPLASDGVQWEPIVAPTESQLWHIGFLDNRHGWIVGAAGTMLKTEDGGKTWTPYPIEAESLLQICFPDEGDGWIVGRFGTILRTMDRGKEWKPVTVNFASDISEIHLRSIKFAPDKRHGWIVGDQGTVLSTDDGGENWELQQSPLPKEGGVDANVLTALFVDDTFCWAVGGTAPPVKASAPTRKGEAPPKSVIWRYRWK